MSAARDGYSTVGQHVQYHIDHLPFTGIDLALTLVIALVLIAIGLGLRRVLR